MKIVNKTKYFFRFRYRKGHNIHSPFVYNLVRDVFMPKQSQLLCPDDDLLDKLNSFNVKPRHVQRWCQLKTYLGLNTFAIDPDQYNNEDIVIVTSLHCAKSLSKIMEDMTNVEKRVVLVVNGISKNKESREWWSKQKDQVILDYNAFGVVVFDKLLSPKIYKLKL